MYYFLTCTNYSTIFIVIYTKIKIFFLINTKIKEILLLLIFAKSAVDFVQSEKLAVGIVLRVQPNSQFKSCAKDMVLYAKRKGANHIGLLLEEAATYSPT